MSKRPAASRADNMRSYWDDAARSNAAWYVDTSLDYGDPDMQRFFENGRTVVRVALDESPVHLDRGVAVEIGSGLGRICLALADRFDRVIGIDVSPEMVARARQLVSHPAVSFEVGTGAGLESIPDSSVDLVLSFTVFQHIPSIAVIERYIAEAGRVLKPGGLFVFQWNAEPGSRRWRIKAAILSLLQRSRVRVEERGRHAPEFLGSRVPLGVIEAALRRGRMQLRQTKNLDTLFAFAWAERMP
jgi:SAM-dependent methyltransferase